MKSRLSLPLFLLLSQSTAWDYIGGYELDAALKKHDRTLIAYVMPNHENSQALEPEWARVQEAQPSAGVISVNCAAEPKLCHQSGITSFPAIRLHHADGKQDRYRGPRKAASTLAFLDRINRPAVSYVDSNNATAFQSVDDVVFIGHFAESDSFLRKRFNVVAEKYRDRFSFAVLLASSVSKEKQHHQPKIECFNNPDDVQRSATEFTSPGSIEAFIKLCSTPLIPELTRGNELSFYETRKSLVHYFVRSDDERRAYVAEMRPLANKYDEYLHFVTADLGDYPDAAEMMGLGAGSGGLSVQNPNSGDVFPYTRGAAITAETVEAFLTDIILGKVNPWRPGDAGHDEL